MISNNTIFTVPKAGGGASTENIQTVKNLATFPPLQSRTVSVNGQYMSPASLTFSFLEPIQIYQDTEIQTVKFYLHTGSGSDSLYMALYKYDLSNDQMVKVTGAEWSILAPNLTASASGYTVSLSSPITIGSGTYYMAVIPTSINLLFEGFSVLSGSHLIDFNTYYGDVSLNNTATNGSRIHIFRTDPAQITITPTSLPNTIPMSQMLLIYFNVWLKLPNLIH